ncbi:hypothetical protein MCEMSEM29_01155 [Methylophilaceae bacterium]
MKQNLVNKKILFIAPEFFGYEKEIVAELERRGAEVDFIPDRPFKSPFMKAVTRLRRELVLKLAESFFLKAIKRFNRNNYDLILVVLGECVSPKLLTNLRVQFPKATFTLYMWDSFKNRKFLPKNVPYFDKCFTFDFDDAKNYGMQFRPLFYSNGFKKTEEKNLKFDISFIGTAHSDRYKVVSKVVANLPKDTKSYLYLFLQAPWVFWLHKLCNSKFKGAAIREFNFLPLSKAEVKKIFSDSLIILDIEHPKQTGLTMRTLETLGAQKKLITTNSNVVDYDFFNPNNIFVMDRENVGHIPNSFLLRPYEPLSDQLYEKYSIKGWLDDVLGVKA